MIKAVFIDYTGTMVREDEPNTRELLEYFTEHCAVKDPGTVLKLVLLTVKQIEAGSHGDRFILNDEKVEMILRYFTDFHGFDGDGEHVHALWRRVWVHAPLYDDVKPFFARTKLPIYILSNDDLKYLEESMRLKGLEPAGIISAETARACKPDPEIFKKALAVAGTEPEETVFIGDSVTSDIEPARRLGITPVYIARREGEAPEGVRVIRSLDELDFTPVPFCTCTDHACPFNPVNHDRGCTPCIAKNLREREIPSCFFHAAGGEKPTGGWHFEDFAALINSLGQSGKERP